MTIETKTCPLCGVGLMAELYDKHLIGCARFEERRQFEAQAASEQEDRMWFWIFWPVWLFRKIRRAMSYR